MPFNLQQFYTISLRLLLNKKGRNSGQTGELWTIVASLERQPKERLIGMKFIFL